MYPSKGLLPDRREGAIRGIFAANYTTATPSKR